MNGIYKVYCSIMPPRHDAGRMVARGYGFKLAKIECRSQLRAAFFGLIEVNQWNSLPVEIVMEAECELLKRKV